MLCVSSNCDKRTSERLCPEENTVEPGYNEGPRNWQNLFAIPRFSYVEVLFHTFYYY